jgi:hypothetical protein
MSDRPYYIEDPPFFSGDRAADMMGWSEKLEAIGMMITALAEESEKHIVLDGYGDRIGNIVCDYAGALRTYINEAYPALNAHFQDAKRKAFAQKHPACAKGGAAP